jgi:hypothetical protein
VLLGVLSVALRLLLGILLFCGHGARLPADRPG